MQGALQLDARRRAMLDEMGLRHWWPAPASAPAPALAPTPAPTPAQMPAQTPAQTPASPAARAPSNVAPPPERAPPREPALAAMPAPAAPGSATGAGVLADAPRRLDGGTGAAHGGWLIVADLPPGADGRYGNPFDEDSGRLLQNMLQALGLPTGPWPVHLARVHRTPAAARSEAGLPVEQALPDAALALRPAVLLAMGPLAAQSLLQSGEPLGRLRGRRYERPALPAMPGAPVVVTYPLAYLLRNPADKARAWADLCLAAEQLPAQGAA